nr:endo-1,4-beta-xylanase [Novosphingobium panipatense]
MAVSAFLPDVAFGAATMKLDTIARSRGLRYGTAVSASQLDDPELVRLLREECSVITGENEFKWKYLERKPDQFDPSKALRISRFADEHGFFMGGHTFAWNQDDRLPAWLLDRESELKANGGAKLITLMNRHATFLANTFPNIRSWDCVNEALQVRDGHMKNSLYTRVLGEDFFDLAFELMREHAPNAQGVYNGNMCWEANPAHRNGVLRLLERSLKRGVRLEALGVQSHLGNTLGRKRDEKGWRRFLEDVQGMGLQVIVTELDCADRNLKEKDFARRDAEVAAFVKGYLDLTLSFTNVAQVVSWGLTDKHSNLNRKSYPEKRRRPDGLSMRGDPFDDSLQPKPMYAAIASALAAAPQRRV